MTLDKEIRQELVGSITSKMVAHLLISMLKMQSLSPASDKEKHELVSDIEKQAAEVAEEAIALILATQSVSIK